MQTYKINENLTIEAWSWNRGRQSWGHEARAIYNAQEVAKTRCTYYNRTWEAFEFQSVMQKLIRVMDECKTIPLKDRYQASLFIKSATLQNLSAL